MKRLSIALVFLFTGLILAAAGDVQAAAGNVWIQPASSTVNTSTAFDLEVRVDSGTQKLGAYQLTLTYNKALVTVDTTKGTYGADAGTDGFITVVNTDNTTGVLQVVGFDVNGKGPGASIQVLKVHFKSSTSAGTSSIGLVVDVLTDENAANIGTPSATGGSVTIQSTQPPPGNYSLGVAVSPAGGGSVSGNGISCPGTCSSSYTQGTQVVLTASAAANYVFSGWEGCASTNGNYCTVAMNSARSVQALFTCVFSLPSEPLMFVYEGTEIPGGTCNPADYKPIGVGFAAQGQPVLDLTLALPQFDEPVDAYFALYFPDLDPVNIYLMKEDGSLQTISAGFVQWQYGVVTALDEAPWRFAGEFGFAIPPGSYVFGLLVTAQNDLVRPGYFWVTAAFVP